MLMIVALALATPQVCTDVAKVCRACTAKDGKTVCSDIGIACQPKIRRCTPAAPVAKRPKAVLKGWASR